MNYDLFGRVMSLVYEDDYYSDATIGGSKNSIYYAIKHDKCLVHWANAEVIGYATYGFFTREEIDSNEWDGDEVYARHENGILYFPKFQCRAGSSEVIRFIRWIQRFLSASYSEAEVAEGLRVYPDRRRRREKWHRKRSNG